MALCLAVTPSALAKTFVPNKRGDHAPNGCSRSDCTLREAVIRANNRAGTDKIVLTGGKTYRLSVAGANEDAAATGDLDITDSLVMVGSAKGRKVATINGQDVDRIFDVGPAADAGTAVFRLLNLKNGNVTAPSGGGGIRSANDSVVRIVKSTIQSNAVMGSGGGIAAEGTGGGVSLVSSTVNNNTVTGGGGGLSVLGTVSLTITNSTISDNAAAGGGGGIQMSTSATRLLRSSTVVRNRADSDDGGGGAGGGITGGGTVQNSIVALNAVGISAPGPDCFGSFNSLGVNLLSNTSSCTGFGPPNIVSSTPALGLLKGNGGPTKTVALGKSSPAVNAAGAGTPKVDQRGVKRKNPDIGAFERRKKRR